MVLGVSFEELHLVRFFLLVGILQSSKAAVDFTW
jgi:hypothetical protein